jgi:3-oxoacyl-[acyl-carrier protein] reductase
MQGQAAIITGGSSGIGLGAARALLDRGAHVCLTGRHADRLKEAAEYLDAGDRVITITGHVSDANHRAEVVERVLSTYGSIDILVNGVGINPYYGSLHQIPRDVALKMYSTNVLAALDWFTAVESAWMGEHGGAIVNVSSAGAYRGGPLLGSYGITKAAMLRLTEQLAFENAPLIRVNAVAPATIRTKFSAQFWSEDEEAAARTYPLGRLGEPADVGEAIAFLASKDASWITGQTILIDGGFLMTSSVDTLA